MKAVLQRVTEASVTVDNKIVGSIGAGWLILLGIAKGDDRTKAEWMAEKCVGLRAFNDEVGKMNRSIRDVNGSILVVSQFTLYGHCQKGRRPSFDSAASPEEANPLYEYFCHQLEGLGVHVDRGKFRADMKVRLLNDGPVTLIIER
jgi:D-tyrosyl-tRNA(Tyr) deacylase